MSDEKMKGSFSETSSQRESNTPSNYSTSPTLRAYTLTHLYSRYSRGRRDVTLRMRSVNVVAVGIREGNIMAEAEQ